MSFDAHLDTSKVQHALHIRMEALRDMSFRLERATEVVYEHTRRRFEEQGGGEWPPLAESTVARKQSQGYSEPERILYAEGNLFESATSPYGPYSYRIIEPLHAVIGIDWSESGVQIPTVLSEGNPERNLPARSIWPHDEAMVTEIGEVLLHHGPLPGM